MSEFGFLLSHLGNNNDWSILDPTEKGYYIELMIYASHPKNLGCIPSEDEKLRHILHIPLPFYNILEEEHDPVAYYFKGFNKYNINQTMLESLKHIWKKDHSEYDKMQSRFSYEQWIDFFWTTQWKQNILKNWTVVDEKLIKKHSSLKDMAGFLWSETAFKIATDNLATPAVKAKTTKIANKKKNTPDLPELFSSELIFTNNDIGIDGIVWLNNDIKNLLDLSQTLKSWREPATETQKTHIWEVGVSLLSGNNESKIGQARSIIAKQVKKYGNAAVSKAIGELASKNNIPSEPIALFLAILKHDNEGSKEEIKARQKRVSKNL